MSKKINPRQITDRDREIFEMRAVEPTDPRLGRRPDKPIIILGNAIDGRPRQTVGNIVMRIAVFLRKRGVRYRKERENEEEKGGFHTTVR